MDYHGNTLLDILKAKCGYFININNNIYTTDMKYIGYYYSDDFQNDNDGVCLHDFEENYCYCPPNVVCGLCRTPWTYPLFKFNAQGQKIS